ncbi:hypothetical protein M0657_011187 [Pyricularia oryzae]|uniref:Uncharacterized protein n=2 Tax=Pyricularia oryzae TaxID=318829 RepID=A0AA97P2F9_PYRO3|nr:hypothetical protein OOU_Y34scaffold00367g1 [Pyricularia oryzae Y34]KAI7910446.1 hypothetical protein M9X92_011109 [Pyricularia oryzae]KAI7910908.1 hypothetical protein M0657_011187 [Pyricularia oryzae]
MRNLNIIQVVVLLAAGATAAPAGEPDRPNAHKQAATRNYGQILKEHSPGPIRMPDPATARQDYEEILKQHSLKSNGNGNPADAQRTYDQFLKDLGHHPDPAQRSHDQTHDLSRAAMQEPSSDLPQLTRRSPGRSQRYGEALPVGIYCNKCHRFVDTQGEKDDHQKPDKKCCGYGYRTVETEEERRALRAGLLAEWEERRKAEEEENAVRKAAYEAKIKKAKKGKILSFLTRTHR